MKRFCQQLFVIPAKGWAHSEAFQRYPEVITTKLDTSLRRYDVKVFPEIESLILDSKKNSLNFLRQ
jgi:hypothetical protein